MSFPHRWRMGFVCSSKAALRMPTFLVIFIAGSWLRAQQISSTDASVNAIASACPINIEKPSAPETNPPGPDQQAALPSQSSRQTPPVPLVRPDEKDPCLEIRISAESPQVNDSIAASTSGTESDNKQAPGSKELIRPRRELGQSYPNVTVNQGFPSEGADSAPQSGFSRFTAHFIDVSAALFGLGSMLIAAGVVYLAIKGLATFNDLKKTIETEAREQVKKQVTVAVGSAIDEQVKSRVESLTKSAVETAEERVKQEAARIQADPAIRDTLVQQVLAEVAARLHTKPSKTTKDEFDPLNS